MAWRSSGSTNDELVDNLKRFSIVSSPAVERGFRNVDRKYFVPKDQEPIAHADQPLKDGNVHLSAPHIYGSALEALELQENSALSFLNIGSGTGYMSCIVASILGQQSTNYGVEIHKDVVQHSLNAISEWKADADADAEIPCIDMIHGNALNISMQEGEALIGFDRIYVGAAVDPSDLTKFTSLLKPGGVLVGPVGDELQKIVRIRNSVGEISSDDLSIQVISGVRFASLVSTPILKAVLPSRVWSPSVHQSYPSSFRRSSKELMLCSHSAYNQPLPKESKPKSYVNLAATLPRFVWMEILSYTHRNWFEPPQSNEDFLRHRLKEEEENCRKAHDARMEAEARCHMAERERDVYRLLARRLQARMQLLIQQNGESAIENANAAVDFDDDLMNVNVTGNLGVMLRGFESDSDDDSDSSDEEAMETEDTNQIQNQAIDEDDDNYAFFSDEDDVPAMEESGSSSSESGPNKPSSQISLSPKALVVRPQPRTVSISEET